MDNIQTIQIPNIVVKDSKTQPVSGAVCVGSNNQIRVAFIEEKLANDELGNVKVIQEVSTQIVMTPEVARNIIHVIEDNLAQNNL